MNTPDPSTLRPTEIACPRGCGATFPASDLAALSDHRRNGCDPSTLRPTAGTNPYPVSMITAGGGYGPNHETTRRFTPTSWVLDMLAEYNAIVRANRSEEWDTVRAVAYCEDGVLGAYGEICELVRDLSGVKVSDTEDGMLRPLFKGYQAALRAEIVVLEGDR